MRNLSLNDLPDEIIQCILSYASPTSAAAIAQTSRRMDDITNTPLLWRLYCRKHFKYWDARHNITEKYVLPVSLVDWRELFKTRHQTDIAVTKTLEEILACQKGRIQRFNKIINLGYDAKDTLLRHAAVGSDYEDHLARRYYSNAILGCLHRTIAIPEWNRLRHGEDVPLERALGAFDMFVLEDGTGDLEDITHRLDDIVTGLASDCPAISELNPRQKALMIARYLQDRNLTGIEPGRDYYNIEHNFLGIALKGEHHSSLPLISAAIYCYVARKFTLDAHPCGFPFHVHVIIRPHAGHDMDGNAVGDGDQGAPMYMDPFRSIQETPVTELQSQLRYLGALTLSDSTFLRESLTSEIVLRCGKNILNSVTQTPVFQYTTLDLANVKYAALWSSMLFADYATLEGRPLVGVPHGQRHQLGHITLRRHLPSLMEQFATDFSFDVHQIEKFLLPLFDGLPEHDHLQESIRVMKASDDIPKQIRRRTSDYENVKYRVGQIFRHRRYEYVAVIIGWDPECGAGEQWMRQMGIDRLRAGRYQSFYHALVEDKSVRYVAEENIELVEPGIPLISQQFLKSLGRYFKRWDSEARLFVSNIRDEYPDD